MNLARSLLQPYLRDYANPDTSAGGGGVSEPEFHALTFDPLTYEMLGVAVGVGGLTSVHAEPLYAPDHEGVYQQYAANQPVWSGGRNAHNQLANSNDFTNTTYWAVPTASGVITQGIADPLGGNEAIRLASTGSATTFIGTASNRAAGGNIRAVGWFKTAGAITDVRLYSGNGSDRVFIVNEMTSEWQRIALDPTNGSAAGGTVGIYVQANQAIEMFGLHYEDVSGRTISAPSDYIPTTTAPVTKAYANTNGNTVTSRIVTEAVGAPLPELPYLQYYPAATNLILYSRDYGEVGWDLTSALLNKDIEGIDGTPNTGWRITQATEQFARVLQTRTTTTFSTSVFWYRKSASTSLDLRLLVASGAYINMNAVTHQLTSTTGDVTEVEIIDLGGDIVKVLVGAGSGGSVAMGIYPDLSSSGGTIGLLQVDVYDGKTIAQVRGLGPIFTEAAPVSTARTQYSFDESNDNVLKGLWYVEYAPSAGNLAASQQIISRQDSATVAMFAHSNDGRLFTFYNGGSVLVTGAFPDVESTYKLGYVHSATSGNAQCNVDGVYSGLGVGFTSSHSQLPFIGIAPNSATITGAMKLRNIQRYDIASFQAGKDIIDALMLP